jgi:CheY-like chemotaxis protein
MGMFAACFLQDLREWPREMIFDEFAGQILTFPNMSHAKRILMVDDAEDHLLVCKIVLELRGYEVLTLPGIVTMEDLFETVYTLRPDLIFTDYEKPGVSGEKVIRMTKSVPRFHDIPVIFFSAMLNLEEMAHDAGANDWLCKPFKTEQLLAMVNRHLLKGVIL